MVEAPLHSEHSTCIYTWTFENQVDENSRLFSSFFCCYLRWSIRTHFFAHYQITVSRKGKKKRTIACDHDRRIANDRRRVFPYDLRPSQNVLQSEICDPRSSAIIWKPSLKDLLGNEHKLRGKFFHTLGPSLENEESC